MQEIIEWFEKNVPGSLFDGAPEVVVDREEITVIGALPNPQESVDDYRGRTRGDRITVAARAEELFGRKVAWGVRDGDERMVFTHLAVPVMTRLRQPERQVLDTLVAGGVARSRSDALVWCVRLVGRHEADWIARLREALQAVDEARTSGPA